MASTRTTNTMVEGLQGLMQEITSLKSAPDADISWLIGLETTILAKLREPYDNAGGQLAPPPGNAMEMGPPSDLGGIGVGGLPPMPMGGGVAAGLPGPGGPMPPAPGPRFSPDVMRRALRGGGVQGG